MVCPKHPKQIMLPTGRRITKRGSEILHCPVCVNAMREKMLPLRKRRGNHRPCRQIVLPPVMMSERWP